MLHTVCLLPMDYHLEDVAAEDVCNAIDKNFFGVDKNACFKTLIGSLCSLFYGNALTHDLAVADIKKIVSYIPLNVDQGNVLRRTVEKHWYAHYVMQVLIREKIKEFKNIKGSTIDKLYNFIGENVSEIMVYNDARKLFFDNSGIEHLLHNNGPAGTFTGVNYNFLYEPTHKFEDIHFTFLYGHDKEILPALLVMSSDSKYLRSTDVGSSEIIWDIREGTTVNLEKEDSDKIKWDSGSQYWYNNKQYCVIDKTNNYYATANNSYLPFKLKNKPVIILFKRPQEISYLCQNVFCNNVWDRTELASLFNSESIKKIEGFPQKNLIKYLEKRFITDKYLSDKKEV